MDDCYRIKVSRTINYKTLVKEMPLIGTIYDSRQTISVIVLADDSLGEDYLSEHGMFHIGSIFFKGRAIIVVSIAAYEEVLQGNQGICFGIFHALGLLKNVRRFGKADLFDTLAERIHAVAVGTIPDFLVDADAFAFSHMGFNTTAANMFFDWLSTMVDASSALSFETAQTMQKEIALRRDFLAVATH